MKLAPQWKLAARDEMPVHTFLMPSGESVPLEIKPFAKMGSLALASFPHGRTFYEILHVTGGRGTHVVDFESHPIRPPALWFISPGQVHFWNTTQPLQGRALLFTEEFLRVASGSEAGVRELAFFHRLEGAPELRLRGQNRQRSRRS